MLYELAKWIKWRFVEKGPRFFIEKCLNLICSFLMAIAALLNGTNRIYVILNKTMGSFSTKCPLALFAEFVEHLAHLVKVIGSNLGDVILKSAMVCRLD